MGAFKKSRAKVILIAQEIELTRELASNNKAVRDKALRKLKKWFISRSQGIHKFDKDDFLRIWKGLFYTMWMSDMPLVQEDLAQNISNLVHSLSTVSTGLKFINAGFSALSAEWFGIDDFRINKFMMLVRRLMRQSFVLIQKQGWLEDDVNDLAEMYYNVLVENSSLGMKLHLIEIYCEELAKIGGEELSEDMVPKLVAPFAKYMARSKDGRLISDITRNIFLHLIHQTDAGIEYHEKFNVWKQMGFRGGHIDAIQKVGPEEGDEDDFKFAEDDAEPEQTELDPRAGRVNVNLPTLLFDPKIFIEMFTVLKNSQETTVKARKSIVRLIEKFETLSKGKFPLGIQEVDIPEALPLRKEILMTTKKIQKEMLESKDIEIDSEPEETEANEKRKATKTKGKMTKQIKNNNKVGKENVKKRNSWQVEPSTPKRKHNNENITVSPSKKRRSSINFDVCDVTEKNKIIQQNNTNKENDNCEQVGISNKNKSFKEKKRKGKLTSNSSTSNPLGLDNEWNDSLQEGETEIFIPSKKYLQKLEKQGGVNAKNAFLKKHVEQILNPYAVSSPKNKRVEFVLGLNKEQDHKEYVKSLKRKSDVPFDALTQPKKGVLKSTPVSSPINPFFEIDRR